MRVIVASVVLVLSRFRVANGREADVREAFLKRPRLVEGAPGFLGLEVFSDPGDAAVFHLVTRWSDRGSFEAWHGSEAHRRSHRWIPKGLKLDATFTRVEVLERVPAVEGPAVAEEAAADAAPRIAAFLGRSRYLHLIAGDRDGTVRACNAEVGRLLESPVAAIVGRPIFAHLTEPDAALLRARLAAEAASWPSTLLNFVAGTAPRTLACDLEVRPDGFVLLGEPASDGRESTGDALLQVSNDLAVLAREESRRAKAVERARGEAERALRDLQESHWHIRKLQEVLPMCMGCGKVKSEAGGWEDVAAYIRRHSLFLSHGYCPGCGARALEGLESPG
jgi:heme-degrading monooxygenase HmoA